MNCPSRQRSEYEFDANNAGWPFSGKGFKEEDGPNSLGNGKVMELNFIKHDGASEDLQIFRAAKEILCACTTEQRAYTAPWMEQGILKRLND